jgi:hypothetical protein
MAARKTHKPAVPPGDPLLQEEQAFLRQFDKLLKKFEGEFVAVYKGRVVDHDANQSTLFRRVLNKLGDVRFLIARVERKATIYECPSVEVQW